jgi:hypothetical protein
MSEHVTGQWCENLRCSKCYGAKTWQESEILRLKDALAEKDRLLSKEAAYAEQLREAPRKLGGYISWRVCPDHDDKHHVFATHMEAMRQIIDAALVADSVLSQGTAAPFAQRLVPVEPADDVLWEMMHALDHEVTAKAPAPDLPTLRGRYLRAWARVLAKIEQSPATGTVEVKP